MKLPLLTLLLLAAASSARAGESVCYYSHRDKEARSINTYCSQGQLVFYDISTNKDVSCGVSNTFNLFGDLCKDPCKSALKGIANYRKKKGKTVVFGRSMLGWAFAEYSGSCYELQSALRSGTKTELPDITDDDLIKAAADDKK